MKKFTNKVMATAITTVMLVGTTLASDGSNGGVIIDFVRAAAAAFGVIID